MGILLMRMGREWELNLRHHGNVIGNEKELVGMGGNGNELMGMRGNGNELMGMRGNGNELMGMGGNGNAANHSRTSLVISNGSL